MTPRQRMPAIRAATEPAPFSLATPESPAGPFVFSSPHSGRFYPETFRRTSRLDETSLRRSEDSFVDELFAGVTHCGAPLIAATYPRAYVDLNREPFELDPLLFDEPLPGYANRDSERVAAGLGTIARVVATGMAIYDEPLALADALGRIEAVYKPYHAALEGLLREAQRRLGWCVLIDCHSMPSPEVSAQRPGTPYADADIVLGDRHGQACAPALIEAAEHRLTELGYRVRRNIPYAGGYCTSAYGRPAAGMHALQIELNRALYMDETNFAKTRQFAAIARDMSRLAGYLMRLDLSGGHRIAAE